MSRLRCTVTSSIMRFSVREFSGGEHGELFQLGAFQLRHEAHGADVHAEKGERPSG